MTGFEPMTLCTQNRCATRLRYTLIFTVTFIHKARSGESGESSYGLFEPLRASFLIIFRRCAPAHQARSGESSQARRVQKKNKYKVGFFLVTSGGALEKPLRAKSQRFAGTKWPPLARPFQAYRRMSPKRKST